MRRAFAVAVRILRQFRHDPRTLFMMVAAPILALAVLNVILGSPEYEPTILVHEVSTDFYDALEEQDVTVRTERILERGISRLEAGSADGMVSENDDGELKIWVEGSDPTVTGLVVRAVSAAQREVLASTGPDLGSVRLPNGMVIDPSTLLDPEAFEEPEDPELIYVYGNEDMGVFDFFGPVFIGVFVFFFVFITAGISFVRERTGGTLERVMATPLRRWEVVLGYVLGYIQFAVIQTIIVAWAAIYWIGFPNLGDFWLVVLVASSMAIASLTLGILVSEFANTELQVMQLLQIIVIPQILLSGMFDLSQTPEWMQALSRLFPVTYGSDAMRAVMLKGETFAEILPDLIVLWGFIVAFFILNVLALKKYRRI